MSKILSNYSDQIEYLTWDSDFFEIKTGRFFVKSPTCFERVLLEAQHLGYMLVYAFVEKDILIDESILKKFNGHLADRKIIYEKRIKEKVENPNFISEYTDDNLCLDLEQLAYESGKYSRFKLDKNLSKDYFYRLYKTWIEKSIKKQIADNVFVVKENNVIGGMVTLKVDNEKGHIGLIAVSPDSQGKGYGKALINACENQLIDKGISELDVPTQGDNIQACKFYEKCGFQIKETINIYHFWI
jgi:ribosomal protein S18 acetylase RimI-like enzyme